MQKKKKTQKQKKLKGELMEIKKIKEEKNLTEIKIKDINYSFANALRRTMMNSIPVLAAENITIYQNSSILFDEYLAQRIAMIPIKTDPKRYKEGETIKMVLDIEGPTTVYSKDIKSTDPKCDVAETTIPIAKLIEGQKIKLEIEALMGKGKNHVKWQAVNAYYKNPAKITSKTTNNAKKISESCPKKILEVKSNKIILNDPEFKCDLCAKCRDTAQGEIDLNYDEKTFIYTIENHGNLKNQEIITGTINEIKNKLNEIKKELKKL
jgi:DNA-directed RNA polymerase subunit D